LAALGDARVQKIAFVALLILLLGLGTGWIVGG
jgi:hypothetical protein